MISGSESRNETDGTPGGFADVISRRGLGFYHSSQSIQVEEAKVLLTM